MLDSFDYEDIRKALMKRYGRLPTSWPDNATVHLAIQIDSTEDVEPWREKATIFSKMADAMQSYTVYRIRVTSTVPGNGRSRRDASSSWIIERRFSELRTLFSLMETTWSHDDPDFPEKVLGLMNKSKLNHRKEQLERVL